MIRLFKSTLCLAVSQKDKGEMDGLSTVPGVSHAGHKVCPNLQQALSGASLPVLHAYLACAWLLWAGENSGQNGRESQDPLYSCFRSRYSGSWPFVFNSQVWPMHAATNWSPGVYRMMRSGGVAHEDMLPEVCIQTSVHVCIMFRHHDTAYSTLKPHHQVRWSLPWSTLSDS